MVDPVNLFHQKLMLKKKGKGKKIKKTRWMSGEALTDTSQHFTLPHFWSWDGAEMQQIQRELLICYHGKVFKTVSLKLWCSWDVSKFHVVVRTCKNAEMFKIADRYFTVFLLCQIGVELLGCFALLWNFTLQLHAFIEFTEGRCLQTHMDGLKLTVCQYLKHYVWRNHNLVLMSNLIYS